MASTFFDPSALLGSGWSFWPAQDSETGGLHLVSGVWQTAHEIISVVLVRPGENLAHFDFGTAPDLFQPASEMEPEYLVYNLEQEILRWVNPAFLRCRVSGYDAIDNRISVDAEFATSDSPSANLLSFPFYRYQGVAISGEVQSFLTSVSLNGVPFFGLA